MVRTSNKPQWLKQSLITGLDQLGVQIISIALYGDLLPGLTNVTDRIRYYSFYPWLLHRYATDVKKLDTLSWQEHLRRAEFLLALTGRLHHRGNTEGGEAIVGADLANKVLAEIEANPSRTWQISQWTAVSNAGQQGSYFKNKNGGFGQYYRGQLVSLGLFASSTDPLGIKLAKGKGAEIAKICDSQKGRLDFWKAVRQDKFTLAQLADWGDTICPCAVIRFSSEREMLSQLLFGPDSIGSSTSFSRAQSLRLLLAMLKQAHDIDDPVSYFRHLVYYGHDAGSNRFSPPSELSIVLQKWGTYQTCEFNNFALEVTFDAFLEYLSEFDTLETNAGPFIEDTAKNALRFKSSEMSLGTRQADWSDRTLGDIVGEAKARQKPLADWNRDPWSEFNLTMGLDKKRPLERIALGFACLIAIEARCRIPLQPFQPFSNVSPEWLCRHQVTLTTVHQFFCDRANSNASEVLSDLLRNFVIGQHLRIAMRKLRYQSQATFKLSIENGHLIWLERFKPSFTNPRLRPSFYFLRDLGLCSGQTQSWKLLPAGNEQLRLTDGH